MKLDGFFASYKVFNNIIFMLGGEVYLINFAIPLWRVINLKLQT